MRCPKCGNENTRIELINSIKFTRKKNWVYWLCGIWSIDFILWILFFGYRLLLALIVKIFKGKSYSVKNKTEKHLICNNCGYSKKIK